MVMFKILEHHRVQRFGIPREIPWELVEPLRASSLKWHNQELETINKRGGFSVIELWAHFHEPTSERFLEASKPEKLPEIIAWFKTWLESYTKANHD